MTKKLSIITNCTIACVLLVLCFAVATTDLSDVYTTVSAPVSSGNTSKKNVSIMFNVCGESKYVRPIIDVLGEYGAGATWFLSGNWIQANMQLTKDISGKFEIGNHAYSHKDLTKMNEKEQRTEIVNTHNLIKSVTSVETALFAPPMGNFNKTTLKAAEGLGYKTIMWSKDTTKDASADRIVATATKNPNSGDFILMYPTQEALNALPLILEFYKNIGFGVLEVGQIIL